MKNKKGLVLSVLFVFFIFGVTLPLFMTNHNKVKADTINNLTNTTWLLNERIDTNITASINFTSNNNNYTSFRSYYDFGMDWQYIVYNTFEAYVNGWVNQVYKTIYITGGQDVTSSTLINWLQNNGTQQIPTPTGTEINHKYWSIDGAFRIANNSVYSDTSIEYTILYNHYRNDEYEDTTQTGLVFKGMTTEDPHSYIYSINSQIDGIYLLYYSNNDVIDNTCCYEFTIGDYMDNDLYTFMSNIGTWFDDYNAYLVGMNQGYDGGIEAGRALGQADGVSYTNLITRIFNGLGDILSIQIFPNITIGLLIGLPLLLGVFIIIIKILRG